MLTDTHCHLDFNKFDEDREAVLQRAMDGGVKRILIPALDFESSISVVNLAESHPSLYAAVGIHPTDVHKMEDNTLQRLREIAEGGKIVAIGEIGLDYYWVKEPAKRALQRQALRGQLRLAQEVNKPVIVHMREENDEWFGQASMDLLKILTEWHLEMSSQNHPLAAKPGVLHSFNGNLETAQRALALNFYIGVTGPVTYTNAQEKRRIVKQIPLTRLLIETDAPFLTPVPHRGKRNEPAFVIHIADKIAEVHMISFEQVAKCTTENADYLFGWGG